MTDLENRAYTLADDACSLGFQAANLLHCIRYNPEGAAEEDIERLERICTLLKEVTELADTTDKRLHGEVIA